MLQVLIGVIAINHVCRMKREVQIANALSKRQHERREVSSEVGHHGAHLFHDGLVTGLADTPVIV